MVVDVICPHCLQVNSVKQKETYTKEDCKVCGESLLESKPLNANLAILDYFINHSELPVIVDFWAPWCGPCLTMAPHFEAAALAMPLQAQFLKINNDKAHMEASNIIIKNIPAVLIFKEGEEVDRFTGARSKKQIIKWVQKYI
jgi:thioredoxin 2